MNLGFEKGTPERVRVIAEIELRSYPCLYRRGDLERILQKHEVAISKPGTQYQLLFDNKNGVKRYVGWISFQWNLPGQIAIVWAGGDRSMTLVKNQISTEPFLERLRKSNPSFLTAAFILVNKICVRSACRGCGFETDLINHLKQVADAIGVKILIFVEGRPNDEFISLYEKELERLEAREKSDSEALQEAPEDNVFRSLAFYSKGNVRVFRQLVKLLKEAADKLGKYPQDTYLNRGFTMAGSPFAWTPRKQLDLDGELSAPQMMCPMEYIPKQWGRSETKNYGTGDAQPK
ncbi:hypothetical protein F4776DRAFT_677264 [Hypoxylon sp. NC0597]|nr:hypothetical protein F4776DRAFT_677264 [Hypoxylon sp. NC0597]